MKIVTAFESPDAPQLELLRAALGIALLANFAPLTFDLAELYGDGGWISREAFVAASVDTGWYSVLAWVRGPNQLAALHVAFLAAALAFTVGWGVGRVKWPLWVLYLSYLNRNPAVVYGADLLLANLLLVVCVAPVGRGLRLGGTVGRWPSGPRAAVCLTLVRWQMALVFFFTAAQKLRGDLWWSGEAVWVVITNAEFAHPGLTRMLAEHFWFVTVATYATLVFELAYPFLIWGRRTRRSILGAAIVFHLGTAALFGLYLFAWVAIAGHMAFVPGRWLQSRARTTGVPVLAVSAGPASAAPLET